MCAFAVEPVREEDEYQGIRLTLRAYLDRANIAVRVDIGFGDHVYPAPERRAFPNPLPDLPDADVLMHPPETVIAETFEAMIRFGELNGWANDCYDIRVVVRTFRLELPDLVEAVAGTLRRRGTAFPADIPVGLTDTFARAANERGLWSGILRRNPPALEPPPFLMLQEELRRFLDPMIVVLGAAEGVHGTWNPDAAAWGHG